MTPGAKAFADRLMLESNAPVELVVEIEQRVAALEEALTLAANRLDRCSLEPECFAKRYEWTEWARTARAKARGEE